MGVKPEQERKEKKAGWTTGGVTYVPSISFLISLPFPFENPHGSGKLTHSSSRGACDLSSTNPHSSFSHVLRLLTTWKALGFPLHYFTGRTTKWHRIISLTSHWQELSHMATLAAKEGGKYCLFFPVIHVLS